MPRHEGTIGPRRRRQLTSSNGCSKGPGTAFRAVLLTSQNHRVQRLGF